MRRPNPVILAGFLVAVLLVQGGLVAMKGGLYLSRHEGDTLHLMDILLRMLAGERIHQDIMTPIGVLAFAPIVWLMRLGQGAGHALIYAQVLVAGLLLPVVWWVVRSRLAGFAAWLIGFYMLLLPLALTYGEAEATLSMSMHYNRWSWLLAYVAVLLAFLPALGRRRPVLDGALIGLALGALVLLKATFFVGLAPAVAAMLIQRRDWAGLTAAVTAGLAVAGLATLWGGLGFWLAYIEDLRTVASSASRVRPGRPLSELLGAPVFMGINLVLIAGIVLLRQAGRMAEGLGLFLLAPGLIYVTYQNFGNDPQWLLMLVAILVMLRHEQSAAPGSPAGAGQRLRDRMNLVAAAGLAFAAPSFLNLGYSAYRHSALDVAAYSPLLPKLPEHADLQAQTVRLSSVDAMVGMDGPGSAFAAYRDRAKRRSITSIDGAELANCELQGGLAAWYTTLGADLAAAGYAGRAIYEVDLLNVLYLFGDFPSLKGAAPWYYGGTPGIGSADYVLIPLCPVTVLSRKVKLAALLEAGVELTEVRRTDLYRLYSWSLAEGASLPGTAPQTP